MSEEQPNFSIDVLKKAVKVRQLGEQDIDSLTPILEQWVRDPETSLVIDDEVADIQDKMRSSLAGANSDRQYLVAEDENGLVTGVMGIANPSDDMKGFAQTDNPIEIVNAFADIQAQNKGVGSELLNNVFSLTKALGATEIIVNSGPRYKDSAWAFYDKKFDGRLTILKDKYGPGLDAPVWSKVL